MRLFCFVAILRLTDLETLLLSAKHLTSGAHTLFSESNGSFTTSLWLLNTKSIVSGPKDSVAPVEPPRRLTCCSGKSDHSPFWLDANTVAFLSSRSGKSQVWAVNIHAGEAEQLTDYPV